MTLSSHTPHKKARIEIIPLIDIMFFLLASFMLVAMSMVKLQKIDTKLPSAKSSKDEHKHDFIAIGIDAKGNMYFDKDKDPSSPETITTRLKPFYAQTREETKVFINCDSAASYDQLITVLDEVRNTGISKVNFAVKKGNKFDASKPRPDTHPGTGSDGAPVAGAAAPAAPAAPPASP